MMDNRSRQFLIYFLLFITQSIYSQQKDIALPEDFEKVILNSLKTKPKLFFKFDSRNSFISSQKAFINGFKIGLDYNNVMRIGGGIAYLQGDILKDYKNIYYPGSTTVARLHFNYFNSFAEYVFFKNKKWQFTIPVQIGFGSSYFEYIDFTKKKIKLDERPVFLYEPSITGQYKFFSWLGCGGGIGYRLMLINNRSIKQKFTSPIYELGLRFFFRDLYKSLFIKRKEKKKNQKNRKLNISG